MLSPEVLLFFWKLTKRRFYVGKSQRATDSTQKKFLLKIISSIDFEHF
jgi:hypothetical protein